MNNSGFNGTGTAFILYVVLALVMPFVWLYRLIRHRRNYKLSFIIGHFVLGFGVAFIAIIILSLVWTRVTHSFHGEVRQLVYAVTWMAVSTLVIWLLIPQLVILWYRIRKRGHLLHPTNPLVHPWLEELFDKPRPVIVPIDGIVRKSKRNHMSL
jgi:glucan phosphoethanolaminetransferase (alkaline phosphatase superfamily)